MLRYVLAPLRLMRRHPWITLAGVLVAAVAAVNLWAWHHFRAAEQALRDDELDAARWHVAQCRRIWGRSSAPLLLAARIERISGHFPEAYQILTACAHLQGRPTEALQLEQLLLRAQAGELDEVQEHLHRWIDVGHPDSSRILEALAEGYIGQSRLAMALSCLNPLLEREPSSTRALHWRGWVHERLQQPEQAVVDYRRAVELGPRRWGTRLRLVRILLDTSGTQEALPHLDELCRTHPDEPDVQVARARCRHLEGKGAEAIRLVEQTVSAHPHHQEALSLRGELAYHHEPAAAAERWLRRALRERPADLTVLYLLQRCLDRQGKEQEAAQVRSRYERSAADTRRLAVLWNREIEKSPHDPGLLAEIGTILLRLGEEKQGLSFLYRALGENANHRDAHEALWHFYESRGDKRQAAEHRNRLQGNDATVAARSRKE